MKNYITKYKFGICAIALSLVFPSCEIEDIPDPNNPTIESVLENAGIPSLNNLVTGTEAAMRIDIGTYYDDVGVVGREYYRFSGADPRFTSDLLGAGNAVLDNNTFYTTRPWNARYRAVKNANILIASANNTNQITEQQKQGYLGFAKTIKAHQLLMNLTLMNENGIRVNVDDPENLGPVVDRAAALTAIAGLLDEAQAHLQGAGETFPFSLSSGYEDLVNTDPKDPFGPDDFLEFNRALAARVAVYRENFSGALQALQGSFLELNTNFNKGVYYTFSDASGDIVNPLFIGRNAKGELRLAHPSFVADATPGDDRLSKVALRDEPATQSGLTSRYDITVFSSNTDPVPIIRNEELILIYAEAKIQTGALLDAVSALNIIRTGHGLLPYSGLVTKDALITEMLRQRRYSLFFEGHRWIDLRRYNRLGQLPIDRPGDDVWVSFPIPFNEGI
ncbi:RagB/SusD family nutrient uptake outer membrane protein [Pontibacter cellulosilyticus]|uniref:RagB/SusD family nutrient uptake outer membrane protein n=1 Tax=Pontibacter cellulosilyticus TaxID=1720253 RepID=A0A923N5X2_9BACT|nr:RagB/SusD family nutrient uptake outer membrane protein [Pontibacter cellulosilyticus]MBC5993495.1 RagB/SusD family nutrient uptake outer membrane protein [Pontibacter cellulosilyticus]